MTYTAPNLLPQHTEPELAADPVLVEHAAEIRRLGKRIVTDVVEIGRHLTEARDHVGHGHWCEWLEAEFAWSDQTARRYIHVYDLSHDDRFNNLLDLDVSLSAIYLLAAPKAEEARQEIAAQIEAGEPISSETVIQAVTGRRRELPVEPAPTDPANTANSANTVDPAEPAESDAAASAEARKAFYTASEDADDDVGAADVLGGENATTAARELSTATDGDEHDRHDSEPASPAAAPAPTESALDPAAAPGVLEETPSAARAAETPPSPPETPETPPGPPETPETPPGPPETPPPPETLVEHRRRCPAELGALLDDVGLDAIIQAMSPDLSAALRARQPVNLILKLRELDLGDAASLLLGAFGWNRLELIFGKVRELRAPKGRKAGTASKPFTKTINLTAVASARGEDTVSGVAGKRGARSQRAPR